MPSDLVVLLTKPDKVEKHPNADKLDIVTVEGWQVITAKDTITTDDLVVYIPPDAVLPEDLSERLGVTKYLKKGFRVSRIVLRGENSFGIVCKAAVVSNLLQSTKKVGSNVADNLGITKFEKPVNTGLGYDPPNFVRKIKGKRSLKIWLASQIQKIVKATTKGLSFVRYTNISNLRHYSKAFNGVTVVYTEKIHGTNSVVGLCKGVPIAASHNTMRLNLSKLPYFKKLLVKVGQYLLGVKDGNRKDTYWQPYENVEGLPKLLQHLYEMYGKPDCVQVFGEIYGPKVQKGFDYGVEEREGYAAFDIMINGKYLDWRESEMLFKSFNVPHVPVLFVGEYSLEKTKELSKGKTTLPGSHIREGVVVRPLTESCGSTCGRSILKFVSDDYLMKYEEDDFADA